MEAIPLHVLPADQLFRLYVQDGSGTRIVLWFKCGNNGDLVTKPLSSGRHVFGFCRVVNQKPKFSRKGTAPLKLDGFSPLAHKIGRRTTSYPHR